MESLLRRNSLLDGFADASASFGRRVASKASDAGPSEIIWWIFAATVTTATASRHLGDVAPPLSYLMAIAGAAGCGWLWLLAHTLFRAERPIRRWRLLAVAAIIAVEAFWHLAANAPADGAAGEFRRIAENAASFICIGAVVLVFVEVFSGYSAALPLQERRFRQIFALSLAAVVAIALLWALNADAESFGAQWTEPALLLCGFGAVAGARLAVSFRARHPLPAPRARKTSPPPLAATDQELAARILRALNEQQRFTTPDLKVADLAASLGEHDYKVTQCVTGLLGYRNFNHLINAHRITYARRLLADPDGRDRAILSIAFDCGFNSIGPFNRAFKQQTGMTPREFRAGER